MRDPNSSVEKLNHLLNGSLLSKISKTSTVETSGYASANQKYDFLMKRQSTMPGTKGNFQE